VFKRNHSGWRWSLPAGALCLLAGAMALAAGGCAGPAPLRDHWTQAYDPGRLGSGREEITRSFNLHRGRWWNYYSRGCWYLELGYPEPAAADFRQAITLREADKRSARTYGMHFWDYFPHRELGVALFHMGRSSESITEIQASLATEDSARAKFYLNRARTELLKQSGVDKAPPVIRIETQGGRIVSNRTTVRIRGAVTDDQYVSSVSVEGRDLFVELAQQRLDIDEEIRLKPGLNTVEVQAADLVGHHAAEQVSVVVDVFPPVLCIHGITPGKTPQDAVTVELTALDDFGLREIQIGGAKVPCDGEKERTLSGGEARPDADGLRITATDLAGNTTVLQIEPSTLVPPPGALRHGQPPSLAFRVPAEGFPMRLPRTRPRVILASDISSIFEVSGLRRTATALDSGILAATAAPGGRDSTPPRLRLRVATDTDAATVTTEDTFFLEGKVSDPSGVSSVVVNGEAIPIGKRENLEVAISRPVPVALGMNTIEISATDRANNQARAVIRVERQEAEEFAPAARYAVALLPLEELGLKKGAASQVYDRIIDALRAKPVRFRLVERQGDVFGIILTKAKSKNRADASTAIEMGGIDLAEGILYGTVLERTCADGTPSIEVWVRLTDTESSEILCVADVYGEGRDPEYLSWLATGLVSKIKRAFPLVQGNVDSVDGRMITLNVGRNRGLRHGMRLLLYREVKAPDKPSLRLKALTLGNGRQIEAVLADLGKDWSSATLRDADAGSKVQAKDKAITK